MSINYVILGFLSSASFTGYDLKKKFSDSEIFHWSGNNNQIYKALVELHDEQLVTIEVQQQASKPPRKVYTITDKGLAVLREWMLSPPELPQFRNALLMQLTWADQVDPQLLNGMLENYAEELEAYIVMLTEQARRNNDSSSGFFGKRIAEHWLDFYRLELDWVRGLREELNKRG